ncbi:LysR family transcriptional regulator [Noviherbaspirillum malthae]|uniref:LysR family transcriptional regulator n=1 Tax=Noviherbaspirillum malthae TaxID=1260987 RepID=UPI00188F5045|nr:LysR family transcriptional regulator [Noviherbaspirillum malthae]
METSLRQLQHLVALAEELSFARAAERVHLSQPALTRSIQALERDLGLTLLDRVARRVTLTAAGKQVLERSRRVLFEARCLKRDVDMIKSHELGEVRFGVGPHSAAIFLADVLVSLRENHPRLHLVPEVNSWDVLHEKLQKETIDFYVTDLKSIPQDDTVEARKLPLLSAGWYVRGGHPLLKKRKMSMEDLRPFSFAFVPLPERLARKVHKALELPQDLDLHRLVECNNFFVLKDMAASSDVVLYAADAAVCGEVRDGRLARLMNPPYPAPDLDLAIVCLSRRTLSPDAQIAMRSIFLAMEKLKPAGK